MARGFRGAECAQRRRVLRETLAAFDECDPPEHYRQLAFENLKRWRDAKQLLPTKQVRVFSGDWGEVTLALTKEQGECFGVLNMANAYVPGGAYVEGAVAQEENMYRRTDCHYYIGPEEFDEESDAYRPAMTRLLCAQEGRVYLDTTNPRICIRGAEDRTRADLGYPWLPADEVFPFYELRASAQDLRNGSAFCVDDARRRVAAQLDTLSEQGVRHVVLGAFGCGAFRNPTEQVAQLYKEEIAARESHFEVIAFAIFSAGYGPDNFTPFSAAFDVL